MIRTLTPPRGLAVVAAACLGILTFSTTQAATKDAAWLQGTHLADGSIELNVAGPTAIAWDAGSNIDPSVFQHDLDNPSVLIVRKDGDYFVAVTLPHSLPGTGERPTQAVEVYVNGEIAPGTLGQASYIRNSNNHTESLAQSAALVRGLSAGDTIEVLTHRLNQGGVVTHLERASLYVELIDASRTAFSATATETQSGPNQNIEELTEPARLVWAAGRSDSGFGLTDGDSEIDLPGAGLYLVCVNVPQASTGQRPSAGIDVWLSSGISQVPGGRAEQGYIRNTGGHNQASTHWFGLVQAGANDRLQIEMVARTTITADVTVPADKVASIFVEKLGSDGIYLGHTFTTEGGGANWNLVDKTTVEWTGDLEIDTGVYGRGTPSEIQIKEAGSYLLVYNGAMSNTTGNDRQNPRITVEVNGVPVPGAATMSHYIRSTDSHETGSATLLMLLSNLSVDDVVTLHTQREANGGTTTPQENIGVILGLIKKDDFQASPDDGIPPRVFAFVGSLMQVAGQIEDFSTGVDTGTVAMKLNGDTVAATVEKQDAITTVSYDVPVFFPPGSVHEVELSFSDDGTPPAESSSVFSYTIATEFVRIPPSWANPGVNTSTKGFIANVSQISIEQSGSDHVHGNNKDGANRQLAGEFTDVDGNPYFNEADPTNATDWHVEPEEVETYINFEQTGGEAAQAGNFTEANGFKDDFIPNIPGAFDLDDGIAAEYLTYLELKAGFNTLGVNSDDGFEVRIGPSVKDLASVVAGEWNSSRGAADTLFNLVVDEDGIYPVRLLWWEGDGGASVEFFSVQPDGEKILINDTANANGITAYREGTARPYVSRIEPPTGTLAQSVEFDVTDGDVSIDQDSIVMKLNGVEVETSVDYAGGVATVVYDAGGFLPGGEHTASLTFNELSTPQVTRTALYQFEIPNGMKEVVADDPVAYWRFGECPVDLPEAFSAVGTGLTGTYVGDPVMDEPRLNILVGDASRSVLFDKDSVTYVDIPDHPDINDSPNNPGWQYKTVEIWFKPRSLPTSDQKLPNTDIPYSQVIYEQGGATRGITVYVRGTDDGQNGELWFNVLNRAEEAWGGILPNQQFNAAGDLLTPEGDPVAISVPIKAGEEYHAVFVMRGDDVGFDGDMVGYLNGEKIADVATGVHLLYDHTDDVAIGARNEEAAFHDFIASATWSVDFWAAGDLLPFDGWIDAVVLYNHELTEARVKAHYAAGLVPVDAPPPCEGGGGPGGGIGIASDGENVTITWDSGTLVSSETVDGEYSPVPNATSPYTEAIDLNKNKYFQTLNQ